jgi:cell division protein FtsB
MAKESASKIRPMLLKLSIFGCTIVLIIVSLSIYQQMLKEKEIQKEIDKLKQEAELINRENFQIQDKIAYFESKDYQEKEAKDKLNLQNPDEKVIIVKPSINEQAQLAPKEDTTQRDVASIIPNYLKWWNYFFKY